MPENKAIASLLSPDPFRYSIIYHPFIKMASPSVAEHLVEHYGLVGKRCLVTGGSMGIGGAIVEEYAALGARCVI